MLKRVKELFLVFVLTALTVCLFPVTVNAASSGSCGDNVTWKLSDDGTLTISGQGDIADCTKESQPWSSVKDQIKLSKVCQHKTH